MGPPAGAPPPGRRPSKASSEAKHKSGEEPKKDSASAVGSKRDAQHVQFHHRLSGAKRAAQIQEKATELVHQIATTGKAGEIFKGPIPTAAKKHEGYSILGDSKPRGSSEKQAWQSVLPTAGLPVQTGHNLTASSSESDSEAAAAAMQAMSQPEYDSIQDGAGSKIDAGPLAIEACKEASKAKRAKQAGQHDFASQGSQERQEQQLSEQTNQIHYQNDPEEQKKLPPVIQKLQEAQQRAHDELEAAEKQSSNYRFPAEADARFVSNARKHKAKLDIAVYEHGRAARVHALQKDRIADPSIRGA